MPPSIIKSSKSGITTKFLVGFDDGYAAEVVLVDRPQKTIICFSTMVGCPVGCIFCYSGVANSFKRKLTSREMLLLIDAAQSAITDRSKPILYSAMGEGEPSLNHEALGEVFDALTASPYPHKFALSISAPHIEAVSQTLAMTARFKDKMKVQYSLHSTLIRKELMRGAKVDPLAVLILLRDSGLSVELNLTLIDGINDGDQEIANLISLLDRTNHCWNIKLNDYNPISIRPDLKPASFARYEHFGFALTLAGHLPEHYTTDGSDMDAACGQLHFKSLKPPAA